MNRKPYYYALGEVSGLFHAKEAVFKVSDLNQGQPQDINFLFSKAVQVNLLCFFKLLWLILNAKEGAGI